jgi:hypothetical protein
MKWHYTEEEKPSQHCDCVIKTLSEIAFAYYDGHAFFCNGDCNRMMPDEDVLAWESIEAVSDSLDTIEFGRMIINQRDRTECKGVEVKSDPARIYPLPVYT